MIQTISSVNNSKQQLGESKTEIAPTITSYPQKIETVAIPPLDATNNLLDKKIEELNHKIEELRETKDYFFSKHEKNMMVLKITLTFLVVFNLLFPPLLLFWLKTYSSMYKNFKGKYKFTSTPKTDLASNYIKGNKIYKKIISNIDNDLLELENKRTALIKYKFSTPIFEHIGYAETGSYIPEVASLINQFGIELISSH